ncbi:hypothetical protein Tco_0006460 [Tanacetum coccineum]
MLGVCIHQDNASLVRVPVAIVTLFFLGTLSNEKKYPIHFLFLLQNFSGTSVPIGIVGILPFGSDCASPERRGYGMIHNDEDGDSDANDGDDDKREISWK